MARLDLSKCNYSDHNKIYNLIKIEPQGAVSDRVEQYLMYGENGIFEFLEKHITFRDSHNGAAWGWDRRLPSIPNSRESEVGFLQLVVQIHLGLHEIINNQAHVNRKD